MTIVDMGALGNLGLSWREGAGVARVGSYILQVVLVRGFRGSRHGAGCVLSWVLAGIIGSLFLPLFILGGSDMGEFI